MLNSHQFQQIAKQFRSGRINLKQFTDMVFGDFANDLCEGRTASTMAEESESTQSSSNDACQSNLGVSRLPKREVTIHKGDAGRVFAIGGSRGMAGAIGMTGLAALRSGAGLVKVAIPDAVESTVAAISPCLMTVGCPSENGQVSGSAIGELLQESTWANVVAIGPGLGRGEAQQKIVARLFADVTQPMVVDADALNALSDAEIDLSVHGGDRVLTPHPGEFQRLSGFGANSRSEQETAASTMAKKAGVVIVLKGNRTFVTDGTHEYRNATGNPGMATAGSGDVLTGVISALIGQGHAVFEASKLGVYLHGIAGDFAAESMGEFSTIATDLIANLGSAFKKHAGESGGKIGF